VLEDLGHAVDYVIRQICYYRVAQKADRVCQISKDLTLLSGLENSLADRIDSIAKYRENTSNNFPWNVRVDLGQDVPALNWQLDQIKLQLKTLQDDLMNIDNQWIGSHGPLHVELGQFFHDSVIFYRCWSCSRGSINLENKQESDELVRILRDDVIRIKAFAKSLEDANQDGQIQK